MPGEFTKAMRKLNTHTPQTSNVFLALHTPVTPKLPEKIRQLVSAACAAHGGAEHMTLDQWRDVERELQSRLEKMDPWKLSHNRNLCPPVAMATGCARQYPRYIGRWSFGITCAQGPPK